MKKIVINGKFLTQKITGVQRYAHEIVAELDKFLDGNIDVEIIIPNKEICKVNYKNIKIKKYGFFKGSALWEQISLPLYVLKNKAVCVNLCNMTPIFTPHIVAVHDINFLLNPQYFSKAFSLWYRIVFGLSIKRIKSIITVSNFSKNEIVKHYGINSDKISIIYPAWQHYEKINFDEKALEKYNLKSKSYFFAMGSKSHNKNYNWIAEVAKRNPEYIFAVAGMENANVFHEQEHEASDNLIMLGYISDEEAKTLFKECKAFLFPTFYEGFGLPPLEAMSVEARCIVSDTECMHEVYGDSVCYIDPNNYEVNFDELLSNDSENSKEVLEKYKWGKSANELLEIIKFHLHQ